VEIKASSAASIEALKSQLKVISLMDAFAADNRSAAVTAADR